MSGLAVSLWAAGWVSAGGAAAALATRHPRPWRALMLGALTAWLAADLITHGWLTAGCCAAAIAVLLGQDWWNRRGKRAAKALGQKSAALLAAVVERMREAGLRGAPA